MKRIYLDQNHWINLLKAKNAGEGEVFNVYINLREKILKGDVTVFISMINIEEALKIGKIEKRNELLEFMFELSHYNTMAATPAVKKIEIDNAAAGALGIDKIKMEDIVFGKGLRGMMRIPRSVEHLPVHLRNQVIEIAESPEMLRKSISKEDFVRRARDRLMRGYVPLERLEELRHSEMRKLPSQRERAINFVASFVAERFAELVTERGADHKKLADLIQGKENALTFFKKLPSLYTYFLLNDERNKEKTRPIHLHDAWDIYSLCMAIPYCDITVAEKMFAHIANQAKLDELYGTKIIDNLQELGNLL